MDGYMFLYSMVIQELVLILLENEWKCLFSLEAIRNQQFSDLEGGAGISGLDRTNIVVYEYSRCVYFFLQNYK
jgi:hypothetical protein